jgi:hypothetical protein
VDFSLLWRCLSVVCGRPHSARRQMGTATPFWTSIKALFGPMTC